MDVKKGRSRTTSSRTEAIMILYLVFIFLPNYQSLSYVIIVMKKSDEKILVK